MNKNIKKYMYTTVELLIFLIFGAFMYFNFNINTDFVCPIMQKVYTTKLVYITGLFFILAHIGGYVLSNFFNSKIVDLCTAYQKRHENISIKNDSDKSKIAALEAKIQTLEAALDAALRNK